MKAQSPRQKVSTAPTFQRQIDKAFESVAPALSEGQAGEAWARLLHDPTQEALDMFLAVAKHDCPEAWRLLGDKGFRNLAHAALGLPVAPLRMRALPDLQGRPLWVLLHERDLAAMRAELRPGQVWVNATDLSDEQYRRLWAAISYQRQSLGKPLGEPGRPGLTADQCIEAARLKLQGGTYKAIGEKFDWPIQRDRYGKRARCRTA